MALGEPARDPPLRWLLRAASVLCLLLAALFLAADAGEYPGLSRAGLRELALGALPLLAVGALNLGALDAGPRWRLVALAADVALLGVAVRGVGPDAPPFFWMRLGVAALLVVGAAGVLLSSGREPR